MGTKGFYEVGIPLIQIADDYSNGVSLGQDSRVLEYSQSFI